MGLILSYTTVVSLLILLPLPFWILIRLLWLKRKARKFVWRHELPLALFILFCAALATQTVLPQRLPIWRTPAQALQQANLIPFRTVLEYLRHEHVSASVAMLNLAGNVLIFCPFGFLPPLIWKKMNSALRCTLLGFGTSLLIETMQIFVGRSVDVDDLILNTLGAAIGYLLFWTVRKIIKK